MLVHVPPGTTLTIRFCDTGLEPMDGEFKVSHSHDGTEITVRESAGFAGNVVGAADAVLYHVDGKIDAPGLPFPEIEVEG